jgi:hypothetical protein
MNSNQGVIENFLYKKRTQYIQLSQAHEYTKRKAGGMPAKAGNQKQD